MNFCEQLQQLESQIVSKIRNFATEKGFRIGENRDDYFIKVGHLLKEIDEDEDEILMYIGDNGVFLDEDYLKLETPLPAVHKLAYIADNLERCIFQYKIEFQTLQSSNFSNNTKSYWNYVRYYKTLADVEKDLNGMEFDLAEKIDLSKLVIKDNYPNCWAEIDFKAIFVEIDHTLYKSREGFNELIKIINCSFGQDFNDYGDVLKFIIQHDDFNHIDLIGDFTALD